MAQARIGVGVTTYNRPKYLMQVIEGWNTHLTEVVNCFAVMNDGSTAKQPMHDEYLAAYEQMPVGCKLFHPPVNAGVARAKNQLFLCFLAMDCDWIFIQEDDFVTVSPEAVTGYIAACEGSGLQHLSFHARGDMNPRPVGKNGPITVWWHYLAGWAVYSRESLLRCGLMDENFHNAWEHIEHTLRLAKSGYTPRWRAAADATGSEDWIHEIPGSVEGSIIRAQPEWDRWMQEGRRYWESKDAYTAAQVFMT